MCQAMSLYDIPIPGSKYGMIVVEMSKHYLYNAKIFIVDLC